MRGERWVLAGGGLLALVTAFLPLVAIPYFVSLGFFTLMAIALASSWNLISGFTGYISFGHVSFFGVGAYTAAILMTRAGLPWVPASLLGGVAAVLLALIIGVPCLRLKGPYFAIAMLGLSQVLRALVLIWESLTRGGFGIYLPPVTRITPYYYAMGLLALAPVLVAFWMARSPFGLRLLAIREDEGAAEVMGINTARLKIIAFVLSACVPGIVGGVYAPYVGYIEPISSFEILLTLQMIVAAMMGGRATAAGPVLGAVILSLGGELVWAHFPYLHQALLGGLIVVIIFLVPNGIMGLLREQGLLSRRV